MPERVVKFLSLRVPASEVTTRLKGASVSENCRAGTLIRERKRENWRTTAEALDSKKMGGGVDEKGERER